jgi:hypothetical protein
MTRLPENYDAWRLAGPDDSDQVGVEEGDLCNRVHEPDEDAPRGYRPKPCDGTMFSDAGFVTCDKCWETT